jgi:hypothetical protein
METVDVFSVMLVCAAIGFVIGFFTSRAGLKSLARQEGFEIKEHGSRDPGHGRIEIIIMPRAHFTDNRGE